VLGIELIDFEIAQEERKKHRHAFLAVALAALRLSAVTTPSALDWLKVITLWKTLKLSIRTWRKEDRPLFM
jgi:hypothetical protein